MPQEPLLDSTWDGITRRLRDMVREDGPVTVVLGLPLTASGRHTELSREVEDLARHLEERGFRVELVNEVRSSMEASGPSAGSSTPEAGDRERNGRLDSVAAMVILKRYLGLP